MEQNAHYIRNIHYIINIPLSVLCTHQRGTTKSKCLKGKKSLTLNPRSLSLAFVNIKQDLRTQFRELAEPIKYHNQFLICPNHLTEKQRLAARQQIKYSNTESMLVILTFESYLLHIWHAEKHPTFRFTLTQDFVSRCTCKLEKKGEQGNTLKRGFYFFF